MSRHVIGTFVGMLETRVAVRNKVARKPLKVRANRGIRILTNDQRSAGVMNEDVAQADARSRLRDDLLNLRRYLRCAAALGCNLDCLRVHLHALECRAGVQRPR